MRYARGATPVIGTVAPPERRGRAGVARDRAGDVRAVRAGRVRALDRRVLAGDRRVAGPEVRPRDDHLVVREARVALRVAGGRRVAGVVEARVAGVSAACVMTHEDAAVDDRDLDACAGVALPADLSPERRRADLLRRREHVEVVRDVRRDRADAVHPARDRGLSAVHLHRERRSARPGTCAARERPAACCASRCANARCTLRRWLTYARLRADETSSRDAPVDAAAVAR